MNYFNVNLENIGGIKTTVDCFNMENLSGIWVFDLYEEQAPRYIMPMISERAINKFADEIKDNVDEETLDIIMKCFIRSMHLENKYFCLCKSIAVYLVDDINRIGRNMNRLSNLYGFDRFDYICDQKTNKKYILFDYMKSDTEDKYYGILVDRKLNHNGELIVNYISCEKLAADTTFTNNRNIVKRFIKPTVSPSEINSPSSVIMLNDIIETIY